MIDLTGQCFGELKVIRFSHIKNKNARWLCQCSCGNKIIVQATHFKSGHTKSCGCLRMVNDLSGKKFGMLTVIRKTNKSTKHGGIIWECICECGNKVERSTTPLKKFKNSSCGCYRKKSFPLDLYKMGITLAKRHAICLSDTYIKQLVANHSILLPNDIPQDLIKLKRLQIQLKREIKKLKDHKTQLKKGRRK